MDIGWMEMILHLHFTFYSNKSLGKNFDNPIKNYDFLKVWLLYTALSGGTRLQYVMTQQYNYLMETVYKFHKSLLSWRKKTYLHFTFIRRYFRGKTIVRAFMIELDQSDYWYPRKINNFENVCTK